MKFSFALTLVFCFFAFSCDLVFAKGDTVGNANDYIDEVLDNLRKDREILSKLEPVKIPDVKEKKFEIRNGQIKGLSSLYRHGDCTLDYDGKIVKVTAQVAVRNVWIELKYAAKAVFFWIKGDATMKVDNLAVRMDISAEDGKAKLDSFKVVQLGNYKIKKITGMSVVLNWLLRLIANNVAKSSRSKIINALENNAAKALGKFLSKYQLPNLSD